MILTNRLALLPTTAELISAEMRDLQEFSRLLEADVPPEWPPEKMRAVLPWFFEQVITHPSKCHWFIWYAVLRPSDELGALLAGSLGFKGPPDESGRVEIGFSLLSQFQGRGLASEMVRALAPWALGQPGVALVFSDAEVDDESSIRVLKNAGFLEAGSAPSQGFQRFILRNG